MPADEKEFNGSMIKVILWDIDETLLNFGRAQNYAIKKCFEIFEMGECTDEMVERYSSINKKYWERIERNELTKQEALIARFVEFFGQEGLPSEKAEPFNDEYLIRLGDKVFFNGNGKELVAELKKLGYIQFAVTNGTLAAQKRKLAISGLDRLFEAAFISDEIGFEKPNAEFFEYVFEKLSERGEFKKDEIMIVGDSLTSDMQGGNNAGIICCWYNPYGNKDTKGLRIDYEIKNLDEIKEIIMKRRNDMIAKNIATLVNYGLAAGLLDKADKIYATNMLLELFGIDDYDEPENIPEIADPAEFDLEQLLTEMLDYAAANSLLPEDGIVYRDLFDTRIMGVIVPRPSDVIYTFNKIYKENGATAATDWYYAFSQNTDYIRRYRIARDMKWKAMTQYGEMDITINLSKPEKDPKAIAAAKNAKQSGYPKCQLCMENEGYAGRVNHPARQNHRIIPIEIQGNKWGFQYSPYVYYNEHCIVFNSRHIPMKIDHDAFVKLFNFVEQFPHYFVGSNADLPIVGGSILSHDHFQGGNYEFAMAKAPVEKEFSVKGFEDIKSGIVKWPMSVIRLSHADYNRIIELADVILAKWRSYTDEAAFIFAETDGEPHNTITPIARKRGDNYELDLVLRNNITTDEHPLGVYHPHAELHHIKKENIGLIEVMGLAVLPSRLKAELESLAKAIVEKKDIRADAMLEKHADWVDEVLPKYENITSENVMEILKNEVGIVFGKVLEHAGVYKRDEDGAAAFMRFINTI